MPLSLLARPALPVFGGEITPPPDTVGATVGGGAVVAVATALQLTVTVAVPVALPDVAPTVTAPLALPVAEKKTNRLPSLAVVPLVGATEPWLEVRVTAVPAATALPEASLTWTVMIEVPLQPRVAGEAEIVSPVAGPTVVVGVAVVVAVAVGVRHGVQSTVRSRVRRLGLLSIESSSLTGIACVVR